jgi:hypothetical protein
MFIQTAAGTGGSFSDTSRIQAAGNNITPSLTLDGPAVAATLFNATVQPFSGTKTTSATTLFINIHIVQENSVTTFDDSVNGTFTVSIPLNETATGGGTGATFSTAGGATVYHALTSGHYLEITPLADANITNGEGEQANFQLVSSITAVPEPASMLLTAFGAAGLAIFARRRKVQQ